MQSSPRLGAASTSTSGSGQPSQPCRTLLRLTQRLHHRYITLSDGKVGRTRTLPPIWAVRARRCPALAAARNRRFCGDIRSCPAAAHLQGGRIARSRRGGRGRTGYLGPCRPGPTPAEPPHGSANVKIAQGKGTRRETEGEPEPGQRPKGTNRRTPDEGKPEEGGRRGGTRRANGKPEESPRGETGGREVRPQTTR